MHSLPLLLQCLLENLIHHFWVQAVLEYPSTSNVHFLHREYWPSFLRSLRFLEGLVSILNEVNDPQSSFTTDQVHNKSRMLESTALHLLHEINQLEVCL